MPAREGGKLPMFAHKDGAYTMNDFDKSGIHKCDQFGAGILLHSEIIVIDIDDHKLCKQYEIDFPDFSKTVQLETRKGKHYYFRRTTECDDAGMLDGARQFHVDGIEIPVDIKTITSTGTKGYIAIPPSPNKKWLNPLGITNMLYMPDEFVEFYREYKKVKTPKEKKELKEKKENSTTRCDISYDYLERVVMNLSDERAVGYGTWLQVVFGIKNVGIEANIGEDKIIELIHNFSKKSPVGLGSGQYNVNKVDDAIRKLTYMEKGKGINMGSLCNMLKMDDPQEYMMLHPNGKNLNYVKECFYMTTHEKCADIYYNQNRHKFIYTGNDQFYERTKFNTLKKLSPKSVKPYIEGKISACLKPLIEDLRTTLLNNYEEEALLCEDKERMKDLEKLKMHVKKNYITFMKSIETKGFIDKVFEFLENKYLNMDAEDLMDTYPHIVGFNNGIYDCKEKVFRLPMDDEYISMSCGYDYEKIDYKDAEDFINDIMIDDRTDKNDENGHRPTAHHHKKCLGSLLCGGNKEQLLHFWMGVGANGKSLTDMFLRWAMGEYYIIVNVGLFSSYSKDADRCSPEKAGLEKKKVAVCSETDGKTLFVTANMNSLTGCDPIKARDVREKNRSFPLLAKFIILTNPLPKLTDVNEAALRRPRVTKHPYSFKYDTEIDINNPFHKPRDNDKATKLQAKNIKLQFMNMMIDYYTIYEEEGLKPSEYISNVTNEYKTDLDFIKKWSMENLEYSDGQRVSTKEVLEFMKNDQEVESEVKKITLKDFTRKLGDFYTVDRKSYKGVNQSIIHDYILKEKECLIAETNEDELEN
jgi:phage/plasmid-associated DNA primase